MTALSWIGFGTLCTKVLAVSNTFPETLNYTVVAISVCASCAAVIAKANTVSPRLQERQQDLSEAAAVLKAMADQTPFAESRRRLMALVERMERDEAFAIRNSIPSTSLPTIDRANRTASGPLPASRRR